MLNLPKASVVVMDYACSLHQLLPREPDPSRYVNTWNPQCGTAKAKILHSMAKLPRSSHLEQRQYQPLLAE